MRILSVEVKDMEVRGLNKMIKIVLKGNVEVIINNKEYNIENIRTELEQCSTKWITILGITTRLEDIKFLQEV